MHTKMELGRALESMELTTLRVVQDSGHFVTSLGRDWDDGTDFSGYPRRFAVDGLPCRKRVAFDDAHARDALGEAGAGDALHELEAWMRRGRHEMVLLFANPALGLRLCHHVHSSALGRGNGFHALRAGGIRRYSAEIAESVVLRDGLNLARAMSFKCSAAGIPFGGSKTTLQAAPIATDDRARVGFIAFAIDAGNLMTGPDVGFSPELIDAVAEVTPHILCGPKSPLGHTGAPTAEGVLAALHAGAEQRWGRASLAKKSVAIQGLGSVGLELAVRLAAEGARITAADPDPERVAVARSRVSELTIVDPAAVLDLEADVLCPSALGGVLDRERIATLRVELIYGGANNQLDAFSIEEELALADLLAQRGISFQPDWSYTMGGILAGYEVYRHREASSFAKLAADIARVAGEGSRALLAEAAQSGKTPTAVAVEKHFPRVHGFSL